MPFNSSVLKEFASFGSATVYEAAGRSGALSESFTPIDPASTLAGPARIVAGPPGDNLPIHRAIADAAEGEVLVVDVGGCATAGHWGEILTAAAQARGIVGLVINGSVRDSRAILARDFPVFHRGLSILAASKVAPPSPPPQFLEFAGCTLRNGDLVVADLDGVTIVAAAHVPEVLQAARSRVASEQQTMASLQTGRTTLELFGWK